jgi:hypothetical protein
MEIPGHMKNGVVVLEGETSLPDGMAVTVLVPRVRFWRKPGKKKRVKFPLVDSKNPGSLRLTGRRIAEIIEKEDLASSCKSLRRPKS